MSGKTGVVVALALTGVVLAMALFFAILYLQQRENYAHGYIRETLLRNGTDVASQNTTKNANTNGYTENQTQNDDLNDIDINDIENQREKELGDQNSKQKEENLNETNIYHDSNNQLSTNSIISSQNSNLPEPPEPSFSNEGSSSNNKRVTFESEFDEENDATERKDEVDNKENVALDAASYMVVSKSINNDDKTMIIENKTSIETNENDQDRFQTESIIDVTTTVEPDLEMCMLPVMTTTKNDNKNEINENSAKEAEEIEMDLAHNNNDIALLQGDKEVPENSVSKPKSLSPIIVNSDNENNNNYCPSELTESQPATPPPQISPIINESNSRKKEKQVSTMSNEMKEENMQRGKDDIRARGSNPPPWFSGGRDAFTPGSWRSSQKSSQSEASFGWIGHFKSSHNRHDEVSSTASSFPEGMTCDERRNKRQLEQDFLDSADTPQPFLLLSSTLNSNINTKNMDIDDKIKDVGTTTPYKIQNSNDTHEDGEKERESNNADNSKNENLPSIATYQESPRSTLKSDDSSQTQQQHHIDTSSGRMMIRFDTIPVTESSSPKLNKTNVDNMNLKQGNKIQSFQKGSTATIHYNSGNSDGVHLDDNALATQTEDSYPWHYLVTDSNSIAGSVGKYSETRLALLQSIEEENKKRQLRQEQQIHDDIDTSSSPLGSSKSLVSDSEKEWYEKMAALPYKFDPKDESIYSESDLGDWIDDYNEVIKVPPPKLSSSLSMLEKPSPSGAFINPTMQTVEENINPSSKKETSSNSDPHDHIPRWFTDGEEEEEDYDDHLARLISSSDLNDSYNSNVSDDRGSYVDKNTGKPHEKGSSEPLHINSTSRFADVDDPRLTAASALATNTPQECNSSLGANSNPNAPSCHSSSIVSSTNTSKNSTNSIINASKITALAYNKDLLLTAAERKRRRDLEDKLFEESSRSVLTSTATSDNETILDVLNNEEWEEEATNRMIHARKQASQNNF